MAEQIEAFFRDGKELGLRISYSRETEPLGTGGALKLAEPLLSDPVLVLNGDSYVEVESGRERRTFHDTERGCRHRAANRPGCGAIWERYDRSGRPRDRVCREREREQARD